MYKLIPTLCLIISGIYAFGQNEKAAYKTIAAKFEVLYNHESFDSIFYMFSIEMQKALPVDKTKDFFSKLQSGAGLITSRRFIKYTAGSYAEYKTNFERALFALDISIDANSKIDGLFVKPFTDDSLPLIERNTTKLKLPVEGEWTVIWGGDSKELNYHVESKAQKNAFDIVITDSTGRSYKNIGDLNEDFYAFGKKIFAPCDGEIVLSVDGVKDNNPGVVNPIYLPGNSVILKTINNEYLFFAHLKNNSVQVKAGELVKQGDVLGLCGNTGNSSEPHLHFHLQNAEDMNLATGIKCYFDSIIVNGHLQKERSPVKGEKIENK